MAEIEDFIEKNFVPVEDKPGFVWLSKRNFQIISTETLSKYLEDAWARGLYHSPVFDKSEDL